MQVLDFGYVNFVEAWGSDERIIESARMSTDGGFVSWESYDKHPNGDVGLLSFLWKHRHTTPFEMAGFVVEIYAPLFVVREWQRHRVQALDEGLSFNEMSGRYVELPNDFYIPSIQRLMAGKQATKNKQGSEEGFTEFDAQCHQSTIKAATYFAHDAYEQLLKDGVSRELARLVIPVNQYSRFRASANLWGWLHFLGLRLPENVQWETREYANKVAQIVEEKFPRTYKLFSSG